MLCAVVAVAFAGVGTALYAARERVGRAGMSTHATETAASGEVRVTRRAATGRADVIVDARRQQLIGVRTVLVERRVLESSVRATGLVRYDETRLTDVNLKVDGWIQDLAVDYTGQRIREGQPLLTLYSPELFALQSEYLQTLTTRDSVRKSAADALPQVEALVAAARQPLELRDVPEGSLRALEASRRPLAVVGFLSPVGGSVIEKQVVKGQHVTAGQTLFKVADLSVVWVEADVHENELLAVSVGARATVTLDAYPGRQLAGRVVFIYPYLDEKTRTTKARFSFANPDGRLKPGMFANVVLNTNMGSGLAVPIDAVLDSGTEQVVFVAQGGGRFEPRRVTIGQRFGEVVQILEGVTEGEAVAAGATFFLDSESEWRASLQAFEPPPAHAVAPAAAGQPVEIALRTVPDPPRAAANQFEVTLRDPLGSHVDDAYVSLQLAMPAMPSMNMPAMRSAVRLTAAGGGVYRGTGDITMAGRWETTVTAMRGGVRLGTRQLVLVAR